MPFLHRDDYLTYIESADLNVITNTTDSFITNAQTAAIEEVSSYLRQRYNTDIIFQSVDYFSTATTYNINNRVRWTADTWSSGTTYDENQIANFSGSIYQSVVTGNTESPLTATTSYWTNIATNDEHYYCVAETTGNLPSDSFTASTNSYVSGAEDLTGWDKTESLFFKRETGNKNIVRIYLSASTRTAGTGYIGEFDYNPKGISFPYKAQVRKGIHEERQLEGFINILNFIPEASEFSIVPGLFWVKGDTRNQKIMMCLIDVTIYHLLSRIQGRNLQEIRIQRRDDAIEWLKMISKGTIMIDLPIWEYNNSLGSNIRFGSQQKTINDY